MEKGKEARKERKERGEDGGDQDPRGESEREESYASAVAETHEGIKS